MPSKPLLVDRFVVGVDVQKYSAHSTRRQMEIQKDLDEVLTAAADEAGLDRGLWERQPGGDGEMAVLPAGVDLIAVLRGFVSGVDRRLTDRNEDRAPEMRMRLRIAMHIDALASGVFGSSGPALVVLSRLLDSRPVRAALDEHADADLALIVSETVYRKVVLSELGGLRPAQFQAAEVVLPAKDFRQTAYLYVPRRHGGEATPASSSPSRTPPPAAGVFISGDVMNNGGDIFGGDKYGR